MAENRPTQALLTVSERCREGRRVTSILFCASKLCSPHSYTLAKDTWRLHPAPQIQPTTSGVGKGPDSRHFLELLFKFSLCGPEMKVAALCLRGYHSQTCPLAGYYTGYRAAVDHRATKRPARPLFLRFFSSRSRGFERCRECRGVT